VGRMAAQTIADNLALDMGLMTLGAFGNLAVNLVAERTILLGMLARVIGKILSRTFMACQAGILNIRGKMQGQRLMGVGMAAEAVFKFEMSLPFMTLRAFRDNIFTPGRMLLMAVETGYFRLMFTAVAGYGCRFILVALNTVRHLKRDPIRFCCLNKNHQHGPGDKCRA